MIYRAYYRIFSEYENQNENKEFEINFEFIANSKEEIEINLKKIEEDTEWDDSIIINYNAQSQLLNTSLDFLKLTNSNNEIISGF